MQILQLNSKKNTIKPIVISIHLAIFSGLLILNTSASATNYSQNFQYNINASNLNHVLNQFAKQSGITIDTNNFELNQSNSNGLKGTYSIEQGFELLLTDSALKASKTNNGYIIVKKEPNDPDIFSNKNTNTTPESLSHTSATLQLPTIKVSAEKEAGYKANHNSLGKLAQSIKENPQSVSVITNKRIEDSGWSTIDQALAQTTGMTVQTSGNVTTNYYSRGFEVAVQKDGINSGYAAGGERELESLAMYEQVEIQRGASGLLTGAGQPGGVVNLVRKKPLHEDQINIALKAGSWNTWNATFDTSNTFFDDKRLRSRLIADYEDKEYFFDIAKNKNLALYGILEYDVLPDTTLTLGGTYNRREAVPEITGVPRNADGSDSKFDKTKYLGAAWNNWEIDSYSLFTGITHNFNDDWSLKINGQYENRILNYQRAFYDPNNLNLDTQVFNQLTGYYSGDMRIKDYGFDVTLNGKFQAFNQSHDLVFGYTSQQIEEPRPWKSLSPIKIPAVSLDDFDPYSVPYPDMPNVPTTTQRETKQNAFFAMARLNPIEPLHVIIGARLSDWKFTNKNLITGASTGTYEDKNVLTPYGGLVFDINDQLSAYASYSDTFRVQSNNYTSQGEPLEPAVGANYEIGLKSELWDGQAIISAALFRIDEDNRALEDPDHPKPCNGSPSQGACYINAGKVRSQGFETEFTGELFPSLNLTTGYTYNKTEYLNDTSTNQGNSYSTFTPKHIFKLWSSYNLPFYDQRLTIGGGVNLQSKARNISKNIDIEQSGYGLWNAFANYKMSDQLNISFNMNNVFDKTYYKKLGSITNGNYYGDPRNFMITLRAKY